jgi:hypothetical protein
MKISVPHPVAFEAVTFADLKVPLDLSTVSGSLAVRVIKADGTSVAGGGTGGIAHGITQPDVTNAPGCGYYLPSAGDISVLGEAIIVISATGMYRRAIPVDVVAYDPYDGIRIGLTAMSPDAVLVGTVTSGTLTTTAFSTNLTIPNGQLANEAHIRFLGNVTGTLTNQVQKITGYTGGIVSLTAGISAAPAVGDQFVVINR